MRVRSLVPFPWVAALALLAAVVSSGCRPEPEAAAGLEGSAPETSPEEGDAHPLAELRAEILRRRTDGARETAVDPSRGGGTLVDSGPYRDLRVVSPRGEVVTAGDGVLVLRDPDGDGEPFEVRCVGTRLALPPEHAGAPHLELLAGDLDGRPVFAPGPLDARETTWVLGRGKPVRLVVRSAQGGRELDAEVLFRSEGFSARMRRGEIPPPNQRREGRLWGEHAERFTGFGVEPGPDPGDLGFGDRLEVVADGHQVGEGFAGDLVGRTEATVLLEPAARLAVVHRADRAMIGLGLHVSGRAGSDWEREVALAGVEGRTVLDHLPTGPVRLRLTVGAHELRTIDTVIDLEPQELTFDLRGDGAEGAEAVTLDLRFLGERDGYLATRGAPRVLELRALEGSARLAGFPERIQARLLDARRVGEDRLEVDLGQPLPAGRYSVVLVGAGRLDDLHVHRGGQRRHERLVPALTLVRCWVRAEDGARQPLPRGARALFTLDQGPGRAFAPDPVPEHGPQLHLLVLPGRLGAFSATLGEGEVACRGGTVDLVLAN